MGKDSGMIYRSFIEATRQLDAETEIEAMRAYCDYLLDGIEYAGDNATVKALMLMAKPVVDKAQNRYDAACENGKKGGRPKTEKPEQNQNKTRTKPEQNQSSKNQNLNEDDDVDVDEDVNEDVDDKSVKAGKRPARHKYGEYKHVLLSDQEHEKLVNDYGDARTSAAIKKVDEYCERTGKTYKNYNLVLRQWGYEGVGPPKEDANAALRKQMFDAINERFAT